MGLQQHSSFVCALATKRKQAFELTLFWQCKPAFVAVLIASFALPNITQNDALHFIYICVQVSFEHEDVLLDNLLGQCFQGLASVCGDNLMVAVD